MILAEDPAFEARLHDDPLWANVSAVRSGRIYRAPALPFGWFDGPPGINRLLGVAWLTDVLYPGRTGTDLGAAARSFYDLFYHVQLTDADLDLLLGSAAPGR